MFLVESEFGDLTQDVVVYRDVVFTNDYALVWGLLDKFVELMWADFLQGKPDGDVGK